MIPLEYDAEHQQQLADRIAALHPVEPLPPIVEPFPPPAVARPAGAARLYPPIRRAGYNDPPSHARSSGLARNQPVSGEPRISGMVTAQRNTLASRVAQRETAFSAAADAVKAARILRTQFDTKETRAGIVAANEALAFASEDLEVARTAARDFADLLAASEQDLARLAALDTEQSEVAVLAANQQIVELARQAGEKLAAATTAAQQLDHTLARARGEAHGIATRLGIAWQSGPLGYLQTHTSIRDAMRQAFRAAGFDEVALERSVK